MDSPKVVQKLALLVVVTCLALGAFRGAEGAVACNDVVRNLMPCVSYVTNGGAIGTGCCSGIKTLYGKATTTADRRDVCTCIKKTINGITLTPKNLALAAGLPGKCGVSLPYKISPSTDCQSVK